MNAMVRNTSWSPRIFIIFGGSVIIMYFAIAYEIWPRLTGREHSRYAVAAPVGCGSRNDGVTLPWHWLGYGVAAARRQLQLRRSDHRWLGPWVLVAWRAVSFCSCPRCCSSETWVRSSRSGFGHRSAALCACCPPPQRVQRRSTVSDCGMCWCWCLWCWRTAIVAQFLINPRRDCP
jgi:hypothetical protein